MRLPRQQHLIDRSILEKKGDSEIMSLNLSHPRKKSQSSFIEKTSEQGRKISQSSPSPRARPSRSAPNLKPNGKQIKILGSLKKSGNPVAAFSIARSKTYVDKVSTGWGIWDRNNAQDSEISGEDKMHRSSPSNRHLLNPRLLPILASCPSTDLGLEITCPIQMATGTDRPETSDVEMHETEQAQLSTPFHCSFINDKNDKFMDLCISPALASTTGIREEVSLEIADQGAELARSPDGLTDSVIS